MRPSSASSASHRPHRLQVEVTLAGLTGDGAVECSRGVRIVPDVALANVDMEVGARGGVGIDAAPGNAERARDGRGMDAARRRTTLTWSSSQAASREHRRLRRYAGSPSMRPPSASAACALVGRSPPPWPLLPLPQSEHVHAILKRQHGRGKDVAAICAAPIALHAAGIAPGAHLTSHPSVQDQLSSSTSQEPARARGRLETRACAHPLVVRLGTVVPQRTSTCRSALSKTACSSPGSVVSCS